MSEGFDCFINNYSFVYINNFIFYRYFFWGNKKANGKMIWNIRLNGTCFDDCVYKTIDEYMIDICFRFSRYSSRFVCNRITPFWYIKFKKSCTFLLFSWSKRLRLKSPAIWCTLFEFFVILKTFFKNLSNDSVWPLSGLYKT